MSRVAQRYEANQVLRPTVARASTSLRRGSTGAAVREVQRRLLQLGYLSAADAGTGPGVLGPRTEDAIKRFQVEHGLRPTGVVGDYTRAALEQATTR